MNFGKKMLGVVRSFDRLGLLMDRQPSGRSVRKRRVSRAMNGQAEAEHLDFLAIFSLILLRLFKLTVAWKLELMQRNSRLQQPPVSRGIPWSLWKRTRLSTKSMPARYRLLSNTKILQPAVMGRVYS